MKKFITESELAGKLGETRKIFKVKSAKSARKVEFDYSQNAKAASGGALLGYDLLIPVTVETAFHTLQASAEATTGAKSSIEALNLIIVAQFAPILSVSPQNLCRFHAYYHFSQTVRARGNAEDGRLCRRNADGRTGCRRH